MTVVVIVLFCATGFIFSGRNIPENLNFGEYIAHLYTENNGTGGGVLGGLIGLPLLQAAGVIGARIIVVLLLFVAVMILTGTTLLGLFRTIKKPVDVMSEGLQNARQRREEEREILEEYYEEEVPLPAHPVRSDFVNPFPKPPEKKRPEKPKKNEKLDRLKAAFGVEEEAPEEPPTPEQQIQKGALELEQAVEELEEIHIPAVPVNTVHTPLPKEPSIPLEEPQQGKEDEPAPPSVTPPVPDEVQKLTEKFMEQKERKDKRAGRHSSPTGKIRRCGTGKSVLLPACHHAGRQPPQQSGAGNRRAADQRSNSGGYPKEFWRANQNLRYLPGTCGNPL